MKNIVTKYKDCFISFANFVSNSIYKYDYTSRERQKEIKRYFPLIPSSVISLCINTNPGRILVYAIDIKDFISRKINSSSFLMKSLKLGAYLSATCIGWKIGGYILPGMFNIPSLVSSMFLGNVSDRLFKRVISFV